MRGKLAWTIVGCFAALSMAVASCSSPQATVTSPTGTAKAAPAATAPPSASSKEAPKPSAPTAEAPKYGGVLNLFLTNNPTGFDPGKGSHNQSPTNFLTADRLLIGDWSKGAAGTNQFTFIYTADLGLESKIGALAEGWKIAEPGRMVFKLRPGVRFALNPDSEASRLVGGREMTADDVVYSLERMIRENPYYRASAPHMVENTTVSAPDKNTVEVRYAVEDTMWVLSYLINASAIMPREVVEKYGDLTDWKNSVGTGPFMLTDYVSGSSATFVKNSKYWDKDPVGPGKGNQLPYLDGVKILILPDPSTQQAALRTAKIDWMPGASLVKDDFDSLMSSTPKLQHKRFLSNGTQAIYMRTDKEDLPFKDIRVRQALTMAIDYKSLVDKLMGGDAEYPGFPNANIPDYQSVYIPMKELPQSVQDLYSYKPDRAKQLLAEAGYPDGFSVDMTANATGGIYTDQLAVIKEAWSKIGVEMTIKPKEFAAYNKEFTSRAHEQAIYGSSGSYATYIRMVSWQGGTQDNGSYINDPRAKIAANEMQLAMAAGDEAKANAVYKDFIKYAMEQAYTIPFPRQYNYTVWWPWLKNYHGELQVGYSNGFAWTKWVWLDQDLKKSMGY